MHHVAADLRYACRRLLSRPVYALLSIATLALGIGGTAAAYGVTRGVLFDPLPYAHASEVGVFWKKTDWTEEEFLFIRGRVPGFQQVALYRQRDAIVRDGNGPARLVSGVTSSAELFDVLGAGPLLGRGLRAGDDLPGAEPVAVLSYGLWRELGGAASVIGTRLVLDGTPRTIVGVMPRGFWFPDPSVRLWTAASLNPKGRNWNSTLVGRVAPGLDVRAMDAPVGQLTAMLDDRFDYPAQWDKTRDAHITPIADDLTGDMRPALLATLGAMALILLIACANVAALMLGQLDARAVEFGVRSALGASRHRLTRPVIVEAALIALSAAAVGAALAWSSFGLIAGALPLGAWTDSAQPDWRVFAAAVAVAWAATLLTSVVPVLALARGDLRGVLTSARTGGLRGRGRLENALVVAEVALAVMIATGAALLARSVVNLYAVDPGVRADGAAVVDVVLTAHPTKGARIQRLSELSATLAALPGVRSVGLVQQLPLRGGGYNLPIELPDQPDIRGMTTEYRMATPGYLESAGFTLLRGRLLTAADDGDAERVIVINEALAQRYFPGVDPVGRLIGGDSDGKSRIVGVVANAVERHLTDAPVPVRYVAVAQMGWVDDAQTFVLRVAPAIDEAALLDAARRVLATTAPDVAVQQTTTLRRVFDRAVGPARQVVLLLGLLTGLALALGAVGIYGVIAHFAARRRRDWAIRVALGMPGFRVMTHVVGQALLLVAVGAGAGAAGAALLTRSLSTLLYGVGAIDPIAFVSAGLALLLVGAAAASIPAWRAGTTDPAVALREQ